MSTTEYDPDAVLADPHAHPIHRRIAEINIRVRDHGERWSKCANCGQPYQITEQWTTDTVCSNTCDDEFTRSILEEW